MACCAVGAYVIMKMLTIYNTLQADSPTRSGDDFLSKGRYGKLAKSSVLQTEHPGVCRLKVTGITCAACVKSIEDALTSRPGIRSAVVSLYLSQAVIHYDPKAVSVASIVATVEGQGYDVEDVSTAKDVSIDITAADGERDRSIRAWKKAALGATATTMSVVILALLPDDGYRRWRLLGGLQALLCAVVVIYFGRDIHFEAFQAIRRGTSNMSLLTSLGTLLAFAKSLQHFILSALTKDDVHRLGGQTLFDSTALLTCVVIGGRLLKAMVTRRAAASLTSLATLMPETAVLLMGESNDLNVAMVPLDTLHTSDRVVVYPGAVIPADGIIVHGTSNVYETHMTGEILPVTRSEGAKVFAGSLNQDEQLIIQVTETGQATWLQKSLRLMADGDTRKSETQEIADRVAEWFVVAILVLACAAGFRSWWSGNLTWSKSLDRTIAVLLAACPCALGLGTPTAVMMGLGLASRASIILKGGSYAFETAARTKTILFDKTGTLTTGRLSVQACNIAAPWSDSTSSLWKWWSAVLAAEEGSQHPVAQAIAERARQKLVTFRMESKDASVNENAIEVIKLTNLPGLGITCSLSLTGPADKCPQHLKVIIGSKRFLKSSGVTVPETNDMPKKSNADGPQLLNLVESFVALDGVYAGSVYCSDQIRTEAASAISKLRIQGFKIGMITGGTASAASAVAQAVGIHPSWVWAELLPEAKLEFINSMKAQHGPITMVGDNLNDIPAMTAADFSIAAFIDAGSVASVASDALLVEDCASATPPGLLQVPYVFALAREVFGKIKQNLAWAMVYNATAILLSMGALEGKGIHMSPFYAGLGMSLSSTLVLVNTMRLERWRPVGDVMVG
ncbi:MAG: hypothetical protein M1818_003012 [Claussenomyces sp. TS43310]|nr:MAG: hypothetical protein M1818_003012 [Claussenomyces sp. TS43310]